MSLLEHEPQSITYLDPVASALQTLRVPDTNLYFAASPSYMTNFTRDSLLYGMLAGDREALLGQVELSAQHQGTVHDALTGEEPGKIHHELDGEWRGRSTKYNACDTTALFLIALARLNELGETNILDTYGENIERALGYIRTHLEDGLFTESPAYSGADNFALRVTYWKDSVLNGPYEEPQYPIVYSLVHFQNAAAMQAIGRIKNDDVLLKTAQEMMEVGVEKLWAGDHFIVARDGADEILDSPSSDSLHALLYIDAEILPFGYAESIEQYSNQLETKAGFRTAIPVIDGKDDYHTSFIWTHEQALLHEAACRHKLSGAMSVSSRIVEYYVGFPELIHSETFLPHGNPTQLWAAGAWKYFQKPQDSIL